MLNPLDHLTRFIKQTVSNYRIHSRVSNSKKNEDANYSVFVGYHCMYVFCHIVYDYKTGGKIYIDSVLDTDLYILPYFLDIIKITP